MAEPGHFLLEPRKELTSSWIEGRSIAVSSERRWVAAAYLDTVRVFSLDTGRTLVTAPSTHCNEMRRDVMDDEGFQSIVIDDVIAVAASKDRIAVLKRSGQLKTYTFHDKGKGEGERRGEGEGEGDGTLLVPLATWIFGKGTGKFLALSGCGRYLAVAANEGTVKVFETETGLRTHYFPDVCEFGDFLTHLSFHPRKLLAVVGTSRGEVVVVDLYRKCVVADVKGHSATVAAGAFVDVGDTVLLMTGGRDKWLKVWNLGHASDALGFKHVKWGERLEAFERLPHSKSEDSNSSSAGNANVSGGRIGLLLTNTNANSNSHGTQGTSVTQGTSMARASGITQARILRTIEKPICQCLVAEEVECALIFLTKQLGLGKATESSWLACVGGASGAIEVYDLMTQKMLLRPKIDPAAFSCPRPPIKQMHKLGAETLLVAGYDGSIMKYSTAGHLRPLHAVKAAAGVSSSHAITLRSESAIEQVGGKEAGQNVGVERKQVFVFASTMTGQMERRRLEFEDRGAKEGVEEGAREVGVRGFGDVCEVTERVCETSVASCDVVDDRLAVCAVDGSVEVLAEITALVPRVLCRLPAGVAGKLTKIALSRKSNSANPFFITLGKDNYVRRWSLEGTFPSAIPTLSSGANGEEGVVVLSTSAAMKKLGDRPLYCVCVAPSDKVVLVGGVDKKLTLLNAGDLSVIGSCRGHTQPICAVACSPVAQLAVTASLDRTIKVWNLSSQSLVTTFSGFASTAVGALAFHPHGNHLFAGCNDGAVGVFDLKEKMFLGTVQKQHAPITALQFLHMNEEPVLLTSAEDGSVFEFLYQAEAVQERRAALLRQERAELEDVQTLLNDNKFGAAFARIFKHRRVDLFRAAVLKLQTAIQRGFVSFDDSQIAISLFASQIRPTAGGDGVREGDGEEKVVDIGADEKFLETLLLGVLELSKSAKTMAAANWLGNMILRHAHLRTLRRLPGFATFVSAFSARLAAHINRLQTLKEKSYLFDIILPNFATGTDLAENIERQNDGTVPQPKAATKKRKSKDREERETKKKSKIGSDACKPKTKKSRASHKLVEA